MREDFSAQHANRGGAALVTIKKTILMNTVKDQEIIV